MDDTAAESPTNLEEIEALFVQTAHNMTYNEGSGTLHGLTPTALIFSDRPAPLAAWRATSDLLTTDVLRLLP